ncbi:DUF445 domain-containing protein [Priestia koreensis]|nr:DUF445 domain-containing protein [Priestia koreensis]UNL84421.1 DUF445 domain-containing protein [Priestia koreensis]
MNKMKSEKKYESKHLASISLGIMGAGFVATMPLQGAWWGQLLQGGFEAGLVGGLADWFAVTALFRHPLGLPIPHTALLPKNRKKMTNAIVSVVKDEWLSKESIQDKIQKVSFTDRFISVAEKQITSESLRKGIVSVSEQFVQKIEVEKLVPLVEKELRKALHSFDMKRVIEGLIEQVIRKEYDQKALDYILDRVEEWGRKEETSLRLGRIALEALDNIKLDGILQFALKSFQSFLNEEKLGGILQSLLLSILGSMKEEDNPNRHAILSRVREELEKAKTNDSMISEVNSLKDQFVTDMNMTQALTDMLNQGKEKALRFIHDPAYTDTYVLPFLANMLQKLKQDEERLNKMEQWVHQQITNLIEENHEKIGSLVQENLDKLDNETLINMVENKIGKDIQWIRVNGAVCGFMIGLALTAIEWIF